MPLYLRAGAVLPLGPVKQYVSEASGDPITLLVAPGANGESFLYEDDGETFNFRHGEYMRVAMQWNDTLRKLSLRLAPGSRMLGRTPIVFEARLIGSDQATKVMFKGEPVAVPL